MSLVELVVATVAVVAPPTVLGFGAVLWYFGYTSTMAFRKLVGWSLVVLVGQNLLGTWALFGWQPTFSEALMWLGVVWIVPAVAVPALVDPEFREGLVERRREQLDAETEAVLHVEDDP